MKKIVVFVLIMIFLFSCKDDYTDGNSYLPNEPVNFTINLLLSEGNELLTYGYKEFPNEGVEGVIVFNNGLSYAAFDMACPHIPLQDCSKMTFEQSDLNMVCPCDGEEFSKIDGAPQNPEIRQAARAYIVTKTGDVLYIRN